MEKTKLLVHNYLTGKTTVVTLLYGFYSLYGTRVCKLTPLFLLLTFVYLSFYFNCQDSTFNLHVS